MGRDPRTFKPEAVQFKNNKVIADKVESLVIDFSGGAKPEGNDFANNEVVGTKSTNWKQNRKSVYWDRDTTRT